MTIKLLRMRALFLLISALLLSVGTHAQETPNLTEEQKELFQVLVLIKTDQYQGTSISPPRFTQDIDGNLAVSSPLQNLSFNNCFTNDIENSYSTSGQLYDALGEDNANLLLINSLYASIGVPGLSDILEEQVRTFASQFTDDLDLHQICEKNQPTDLAWNTLNNSEIIAVPAYLYEVLLQTQQYANLAQYEAAFAVDFDSLLAIGSERSAQIAAELEAYEALSSRYASAGADQPKALVGSLIVSYTDTNRDSNGFYQQNICTLSYNGDDATNIISYRELADEMLAQRYVQFYEESKFSLQPGRSLFAEVFDDVNAAYLAIKSQSSCNIFVDYAENIQRLKTAFDRDERTTGYGVLVEIDTLQADYATRRGYQDYPELLFADQIGANMDQLAVLREAAANSQGAYDALTSEIIEAGYAETTNIGAVITYLADKAAAQAEGLTVIEQRDQRIAAERAAAEAQRQRQEAARAEYAREYPYKAVLACSFGGSHTNIAACFAGGQYVPQTTLEITNGTRNQTYQAFNLNQAGRETREGLVIDLRESFEVTAQNSHETLILQLTITRRDTGAVVFQDSAAQYGVIRVSD